MIALCGTMINDTIVIFMAKYWRTLGLEFFLVGAILDGCFGSFTTTMAATNAYVADCTTPERRAVSFAYIQSVFFLGIAVGPVIGGVLINRTGSVVTLFYCALAVHLSFALFILFLIPESVTPEHMSEASRKWKARHLSADGRPHSIREWRWWINMINFLQPLEIFWPKGRGTAFKLKRRNLVILGIVDGILLLNIGAFAVIILYPIYEFNWGDLEVTHPPPN
jgi:MFS family permease